MIPKKIIAGLTAALLLSSSAVTQVSAYAENTADTDVIPAGIYADDISVMPESTNTEDEYDYEIMHSPTYHDELNEEFFSNLMSDVSYFSLEPEPITFQNSYYDQLDEESQFIYEIMLENLRDKYKTGTITIPLTKNFANDKNFKANSSKWVCSVLWPAFSALLCDHPEMSWLRMMDYSWNYSYFNKNDKITKLHDLKITFEETSVDYGTYADIEKAVSSAVKEINAARGNNKSVYNTLLQINNYLCRKITYNFPAADESSPAYTDEQREIYQTAYSAFFPCNGDKQIKTVCAGYARGFKVLCDVYGITCVVARGDSYSNGVNEGPHAWNYVKLGDDWWAVDVTWNDNADNDNAPFNNYFLVAANDLPDSNTKETFEQSHRAERYETGLETSLFQYPVLKGAGAKANLKSECAADSADAKVKTGDGDVSKMGAEVGIPEITDRKGNIIIRPDTFPDEDFRNWVSKNIDVGKNGKLSANEVFAVTNMDISQNGIAYLDGIEFFKNLTQFNCSDNIIENLDINRQTALTELNCSGNQLTNLDISNNTVLENLDCSGNQLTSLDVSNNTAVTALDCSGNQLESLDLSVNTALTSLNYSGNPIKSFTLPIIPAVFPDETFRKWVSENIDSDNNGILSPDEINIVKSVNVSNIGISDLKGIECFIHLTELDCSKNKLTDIDISSNSELVSLDITGNALEIIDISSNAALRHINTDVTYVAGPDTDLISINGVVFITATAFPDKKFRFWLSKIADDGNDGELYPDEIMNIRAVDISDFDISDLSGIEYLTNLTSLDCSGNKISKLDISKNTALASLNCSCNQLTELNVSRNTALTSLNCSINKIENLDLSSNTALASLNCSMNNFSAIDVSKNTALTSLNCSINRIEELDVSRNTALTALNCSGNQLKSLDVSQNTELVNLDYSSNPITEFKPVQTVTTTVPSTTAPVVTTEMIPITTTAVSVTTQPETTVTTAIVPITTTVTTSAATTTILTAITTAKATAAQVSSAVSDTTTASAAATATKAATTAKPATEATAATSAAATTVKSTSVTRPATETTATAAATTAKSTSVTRPATETTTSAVPTVLTTSFTVPATAPATTTVYYESVVTKVNAEIKADVIADIPEGKELSVIQEGCKFVFDPSSVENIKETVGNKGISLDYGVTDKDTLYEDITNEKVLEAIGECDAVLSFMLSDTDGKEVVFSSEEGGTVTVTVPYIAPAGTEKVEVYNVNSDGIEQITDASYNAADKTITFSAGSSSYYAVKSMNKSGETLKKPELPQTGNNVPVNYAITVSAVMLTVTGAFVMLGSGIVRRKKEYITK